MKKHWLRVMSTALVIGIMLSSVSYLRKELIKKYVSTPCNVCLMLLEDYELYGRGFPVVYKLEGHEGPNHQINNFQDYLVKQGEIGGYGFMYDRFIINTIFWSLFAAIPLTFVSMDRMRRNKS